MEHSEDFPSFPSETEDELSEAGEGSLGLGFTMGNHTEVLGGGDEEEWEEEEDAGGIDEGGDGTPDEDEEMI